jgi:dipeptidase E
MVGNELSQRIVAIGGGEIGRPKEGGGTYPLETIAIDKEIIKLSKKKNPKMLFIPTASSDSSGYVQVVKDYFGKKHGCKVSALLLKKEKYLKSEIEKRILSADIIYVGGGNTLKMMKLWRKLGVDKILSKAREKGIILSGLSAGAICWFSLGNSDSRKFKNPKADYIKVNCLSFIPALLCPHYDVEKSRQSSLKKMMKKTSGVAIALENCSALEVVGEKARLITSKPNASGYKIFWSKGKYIKEKLEKNKWILLSDLVKKN